MDELLVRLKLIQNSIQRVLHQVDKGTLKIPEIKGYSLITELNDIDELCDLNQNYFQEWKETQKELFSLLYRLEDIYDYDNSDLGKEIGELVNKLQKELLNK